MKYSIDVGVYDSADVIVAGAGPAGIAATVTLAREGFDVLLVERSGVVGGAMVLSDVTTYMGEVAPGTISDEIASLIKSPDTGTAVDKDRANSVLKNFLVENGVRLLLQVPIIDVIVKNDKIKEIVALLPDGPALLKANYFIDSTGDGYLAYRASCPFSYGRDEDGLVQPVSMMFHLSGVDPDCILHCRHEEDDFALPDGSSYLEKTKECEKSGELPQNVSIVRLYPSVEKGTYLVNATQICGVNTLDAKSLSDASIELEKQKDQVVAFLRKNVPGFEHAYVLSSAQNVGVRESRRFKGMYTLTADDIIKSRTFKDAVVHGASFPIDIHNPNGGGQAESDGLPVQIQSYDIPLGCLQPVKIENLCLSGRNISGTHRAHASYRVMRISSAIGQASGAIVACALRDKCPIQKVDAISVRSMLIKEGVEL